MPDGPTILCPVNATKSTPSAATSTARWGTDWEASSIISAPTSRTRARTSATGLTVPSTFDWWTIDTIFVRSPTRSFRPERSRRPSSVTGNQRNVAPVRCASSCHGTMLEWCSISEMTISSPGPSLNRSSVLVGLPKAYATRLSASEAFLVKMTSSRAGAPMKAATLSRAPS